MDLKSSATTLKIEKFYNKKNTNLRAVCGRPMSIVKAKPVTMPLGRSEQEKKNNSQNNPIGDS